MTSDKWQVIGRGFFGWHAEAKNVKSSGGDLYPRKWWARGWTEGYLFDAEEGALVYDASGADKPAFVQHVISGPMLNLDLSPNEVDKFSSEHKEVALSMVPGLGGCFKTMAILAQDEKFSGLDYVGVGIYEALLWRVPGIKIGRVRRGVHDSQGSLILAEPWVQWES